MSKEADLGKLLENILRAVPLFKAMSEQDFVAVAPGFRGKLVRKGQTLFRQGSPGDSLVVVGRGKLAVRFERPDGSTLALRDLGPGEVIGEMSCIDPAPRSATVVAAVDSIIFELDRTTLRTLRDHAPSVVVAIIGGIIHQLADRIRDIDAQIDRALMGDREKPGQPAQQSDAQGGATFMEKVYRYLKGNAAQRPGPAPAPKVEQGPRPVPFQGKLDLVGLRSLEGLTQHDLDLLVNVAPPMIYPDGGILCREGAPASSCFLIARGKVQVIKSIGGTDRVLATLGSGSFVGQMALIDRTPRSASVKAAGEAVVLSLGREFFDKLIAARSPLALRFQEQIAIAGIRQLRTASARLATVLAQAAPPASEEPKSLPALELHVEPEREPAAHAPAAKQPPAARPAASRAAPAAQPSPSSARPAASRPAPGQRGAPHARPPSGQDLPVEEMAVVLSYIKTTLREWDMSLDDLEKVKAMNPED